MGMVVPLHQRNGVNWMCALPMSSPISRSTSKLPLRHGLKRATDPGEGEWWPVKSLDKAGLPTLFNKVAKAVIVSGQSKFQESDDGNAGNRAD